MGSQITENSVKLAAESVDVVDHICKNFERQNSECKPASDKHSSPSFEEDYKLILNVLEEQEIFVPKTSRQHTTFKFQNSLLQQLHYLDLIKWIKHTTNKLL